MAIRSAIAVFAVFLAIGAISKAEAQQACDRQCLSGVMTSYLAALASHDPARLPKTTRIRFTENGVAIPLGEALWFTIERIGTFRSDYVDTQAQQVAAIVSFVENGRPGLMSIRLRVESGGKISEVETVLNRNNPNALNMQPPEPLWQETEPPTSRLTRDQLRAGAEGYLKAVSSSDSRYVRFNPRSCIRFENSGIMAMAPDDVPTGTVPKEDATDNWLNIIAKTLHIGCAAQLDTKVYSFITSYDNARFPVIDVERQIVFAQFNFRRAGRIQGIEFEGKRYIYGSGQQFPNENLLGEAFKFRDGGIMRVHGVFLNSNVYRSGTGWDHQKR